MHSVSWDEARKTAMLFVLRSDQGEEKNPILFCSLAPTKGPVIWSRVTETTLPLRQLYRAFICENFGSCRPSQT